LKEKLHFTIENHFEKERPLRQKGKKKGKQINVSLIIVVGASHGLPQVAALSIP